jgi:serine/threonine protein kinase
MNRPPARPPVELPAAPRPALCDEAPGRYAWSEEVLGEGSIGRVRLAVDGFLQREVAIKELVSPGQGRTADDRLARFFREARIAARLEHPGVVPIYELGQRPDGSAYYAMKRVRGRTLGAAMGEAASMQARLRLVPNVIALCQTLAYAHSAGVIHRDIKPANVMVGAFGETLVIDWGLARASWVNDPGASEAEPATRTLPGQAIGTPSYMSPEQARGAVHLVGPRSDVWSLGAVLYELLTGRPPYVGENAMQVLRKVGKEPPPPVMMGAPQAPPGLAAIAEKALQLDPEARYSSAAAMAEDLSAWLAGQPISLTPRQPTFVELMAAKPLLAFSVGVGIGLLALGTAVVGFLAGKLSG